MKLIYFYPKGRGAPVTVARCVLEELTKNLDKIPFELKILCPRSYEKRVKGMYEGIEIITIKNLLRNLDNSIVHIPTSPLVFPNLKFLLQVITNLKRKTLIVNWHSEPKIELKYKFRLTSMLNYLFSPYLFRSADINIAHSYILKELITNNYATKKTVVIPNGISNDWFENAEHVELDDNSIFYHGRFDNRKGVHLLFTALKVLVKKDPSLKLYLAGDGPYGKSLKIFADKLNLNENVAFLGMLSQREIKKYLNSCSVAIYPSLWDNFPLAFIEAFASASCPVIYSRKAGIHDFVVRKGYNLLDIEPTVENIQNAIEKVFVGDYDPNIILEQKRFANEFRWNNIAKNYIAVYNKVYNKMWDKYGTI